MHLTTLEALIAVILGTGGIGKGTWGTVAAILRRAAAVERRAVAAEKFHADVTSSLNLLTQLAGKHDQQIDDHERRLLQMEARCPLSSAPRQPPSLPAPVSTRIR